MIIQWKTALVSGAFIKGRLAVEETEGQKHPLVHGYPIVHLPIQPVGSQGQIFVPRSRYVPLEATNKLQSSLPVCPK